jgi:molybdopterin/thiamine biosynthesis adenylyltransferase
LQHRYPNVSVETRNERLTADNAHTWFQQTDFVIDACDDPATKFLLRSSTAAYCARADRP